MKKQVILMAVALLAVSCQEEEFKATMNEVLPSKGMQVVQITKQGEIIPFGKGNTRSNNENATALQFVSESAYQQALKTISTLNKKEKLFYVTTENFSSLQQIAKDADQELEIIGSEASSEADFREKYAKYVEKYEGILITNPYDKEDLSLYVPDGDNLETYFANENQQVVIANEIKDVSLNNDLSDSDKSVVAPLAVTDLTNQYTFNETNGSKKTTGSVTIETHNYIRVHVGCQKKMWYGWKRDDNRDVYFNLAGDHMVHTYQGPYTEQPSIPVTDVRFYVFHNDGNFSYKCGEMKTGETILNGTLSVWTDMTAGPDSTTYTQVYMNPEKKFGTYKIPTCRASNALGGSFTIKDTSTN